MEKDLLIGDYLFVNKIAYGPKLPQTPLAVPFFHNNIPGTYTKSYLHWFGMDYHRLPGYTDVERNDIVVFNYPAGDTALLEEINVEMSFKDTIIISFCEMRLSTCATVRLNNSNKIAINIMLRQEKTYW